MRGSIDEILRDLPQVLDRAGVAPNLDAMARQLTSATRRPPGGRKWLLGGVATLVALLVVAAMVRSETAQPQRSTRQGQRVTAASRTYPVARRELARRLSGAPIPVYLPRSVGQGAAQASIDANYQVTRTGYSVTFGYGPKAALPFNSPKAQFGNAELLMTVLGTGPMGHLDLSQWIPLPGLAPIPGAAQGEVELGHGILGTTFVGGAGHSATAAVTWQEGGWTFWVGPWLTAEWGSPVKVAAQQATAYLHAKLPGRDGVAVFAAGQDAPSEAVFSVGGNRYAVLALGYRAVRYALAMAPVH
jgi:hypothetical protein